MNISILGTGAIGAAFAEALLKAGHNVTVYNRTAARLAPLVALGAKAAATPSEAIAASDASVIALTDADALAALLFEVAPNALSGAQVLNLSSTRPEEILVIGDQVAAKGGRLAEVTVNVGPDQVRDGQGMYMLGCAAEDEALWTGILTSAGGSVLRAGALGDASKAELPLLVSYIFGVAAAAHIAATVGKYNTPTEILQTYIYPSLPMAEYLVPQMLGGQFADASASVDAFAGLASKSVDSFTALGLSAELMDALATLFKTASAKGFGSKDGAAVIEALMPAA